MRKGEKRKQELLRIAYRMFLTGGYENTSVDEIIEEAGIAKGTYYYHFSSKEQMLEEVIGMMIEKEAERAKLILDADIPIPQKMAGIIAAFRPTQDEQTIGDVLNRPENLLMHEKIMKELTERVVPLLNSVIEDGIKEGLFYCDNIPERIRILLITGESLFDRGDYTKNDVIVFIDLVEKLLGAKPGTMGWIRELIK